MIIKLAQNLVEKEQEIVNEIKRNAIISSLGVSGAHIGTTALGKIHRGGHIDGMTKNKHYTPNLEQKIESIKQNGLQASRAGQSIISQKAQIRKLKDSENKVYLSRSMQADQSIKGNFKDYGEKVTALKVNIPYEDLKNELKEVKNPELLGLNKKEFTRFQLENGHIHGDRNNPREYLDALKSKKIPINQHKNSLIDRAISRFTYGSIYDALSEKGTITLEGDLDSKYIKGSPNALKYGMKDFAKYVKKNPGRFAKGVAGATTGAALVGGGAHATVNSYRENRKLKKELESLRKG